MKKIFITAILFFLALSILAGALDNTTAPIVSPAYGVTIDQFKIDTTLATPPHYTFGVSSEALGNTSVYNSYYSSDFSHTPFDGNINIFPVGEPLPSPLMTLIVALGTLGIIYMCRLQSAKGTSPCDK